jgi:uncharacterized protein (TIGR02145 family)
MNKLLLPISLLLIAIISISCDKDDGPTQPPGTWTCGNPIEYEGKTYKTVQISDQCWLKENLNVGTRIDADSDASDNGTIEKYCYNDNEENCDKVGGLYKWNEAMQYTDIPWARGICPPGWYIPTITDFQKLAVTVNYNGNALKSRGQGSGDGAGTNTSGFSALLSGFLDPLENKYRAEDAIFWSSSEFMLNGACYLALYPDGSGIEISCNLREYGFSVRCFRGNFPPNRPLNPNPPDYSMNVDTSLTISWTCTDPEGDSLFYNVYFGLHDTSLTIISSNQVDTSFTLRDLDTSTTYHWMIIAKDIHGDSTIGPFWRFTTEGSRSRTCGNKIDYSGKAYNTVLIGTQCWLKENLDVGVRINGSADAIDNGTIEKYCNNDDPANCNIYGGLYQWNEAIQYTTTPGAKGICPSGWHIPTLAEFDSLIDVVSWDGNALKAIGQGTGDGEGTNKSRFSALLAGYHDGHGNFFKLSNIASFWSSSESYSPYLWEISLVDDDSGIHRSGAPPGLGYSVRCIQD